MTAQQLQRLAELSAFAHDFYRRSNPAAARRFQDTAHTATLLAGDLAKQEDRASVQRQITDLRVAFDGPAVA
jgi:hypothetical protein